MFPPGCLASAGFKSLNCIWCLRFLPLPGALPDLTMPGGDVSCAARDVLPKERPEDLLHIRPRLGSLPLQAGRRLLRLGDCNAPN